MKQLENGKLLFEFGEPNENLMATEVINCLGKKQMNLTLHEMDKIREAVVYAMNLAVALQGLGIVDINSGNTIEGG